ncbi:acyl-coenzyme A thioesterase 9, mitochondrial-like [Haemaphysalis longicornis]
MLLRRAIPPSPASILLCSRRNIITCKEPIRPKTTEEVKKALKSYVGYIGDASAAQFKLPKRQDEIPTRTMQDSYDECIIPVKTSRATQKTHLTAHGFVRFGRILEDMDEFAAWLAYRHVLYPKLSFGVPMPVNMVTALVDSINSEDMHILPEYDLKISGHISWVGSTSMEVTMELSALLPEKASERLLTAKFVMVAMMANSNQPVVVNKLELNSDEETAIFNEGVANIKRRREFKDQGILKKPPTQEERDFLHKLFLEDFDPETYILKSTECPENAIWMQDAKLAKVIICQPEFENLYNKVFGGFLMRNAYELARSTVHVLCGRRPVTFHTDDIWFRRPVELGSLLHSEAQVVYTRDDFMQLIVNATVIKPDKGTKEIVNVFRFTFRLGGEQPALRVIPRSFPESMLFIEGRRYLDLALAKRKSENSHRGGSASGGHANEKGA